MASIRVALQRIGVDAGSGLRAVLASSPSSLRELVRVATLPDPRLPDLKPDDPDASVSFGIDEPQGIAYFDGATWFLSCQSAVLRVSFEKPDPLRPGGLVQHHLRRLDDLLDEGGLPHSYDHIGAVSCWGPVVYLPVRRKGGAPHLVLGLSWDLHVIGWAELEPSTGESACAVHPWNGLLYLPAGDESGLLHAYVVRDLAERAGQHDSWGQRLNLPRRGAADIQLYTPSGEKDQGGTQGLAFSPNGRIWVTRMWNAVEVAGPAGGEYVTSWYNYIFVYNALTGVRFGERREWNFSGISDEIEGIAVHPSGALYVAVANNGLISTDYFDIYTFWFPGWAGDKI